MNITQAFPSKYLRAADLEGDTIYTINSVTVESIGMGNSAEDKPVIYFNETDKGLGLNKTNANTISALYGPDTDGWTNKPITLFATEVDFQGKQTLAIRIRMKKPTAAPAKPTASTTPTGNPALAARSAAWQAFIDATPSYDDAKRKEKWRDALKVSYPGVAEKSVTAEDWYGFEEKIKDSYDQTTGDFLPF